ncbi:hypothetical protein Tco_1317065 [Tanacetum coccineum]
MKTVKASKIEPSQEQQTKDPNELSDEELKDMMELVPVEEVYFETLQVKRPIIAWGVHTEGQIKLWMITRVGDYTELNQTFEDMMKRFDREDLDNLWSLVQETNNTESLSDDKGNMLWVELQRLYEPDSQDQLWEQLRHIHDPLEWKLYDTCRVHHVFTGRGQEIFMLVEKDYPITKGLATLMLCNKLQVDQYSKMANALMVKIYTIANRPR